MVVLIVMSMMRVSIGVALAADAYLRPSELLELKRASFVPGRPGLKGGHRFMSLLMFPSTDEAVSKAHQFDESVLLDSPQRQWITEGILRCLPSIKTDETFVGLPYAKFLEVFTKAAARAGLEAWQVTPHVLRHTGPSSDYLDQVRSLGDIQRRGRWASATSVRRYERSSRVVARLRLLPESTVRFLEQAHREVPDMVARGVRPSDLLLTLLARVGRNV